jgi:hypothetical protein
MALCECGCGQKTKIGQKSGQPNRFIRGHHMRGRRFNDARGPESPSWRGGRCITAEGYVSVWIPADHPVATGNGRRSDGTGQHRALEHRVVAFNVLKERGIEWQPSFSIHHRNERRDDNRPHNLIAFFGGVGDHVRFHWHLRKGLTEEQALQEIGEGLFMILGEEPVVKKAADVAVVV